MKSAGERYLKKCGEYWYYNRRVPKQHAHVDPRREIKKSTKQRNRLEAIPIAEEINRQTEIYWQALETGDEKAGALAYKQAVRRARVLGVNYKTLAELATGGVDEVMERMELLDDVALVDKEPAVSSVLGSVEQPSFNLENIADAFFDLSSDILLKKKPDQVRKWKNPRLKALRNLRIVVGNKEIANVSRNDALQFRNWWLDRVRHEEMDIGTANKDIGHINQMINEISDKYQLDLNKPFGGMRLRGEKHNPRPPFEPQWVEERILAPGALDGLNYVCRVAVYTMAFCGMRPSEIVALEDGDMLLTHRIPHVKIHGGNRSLKTEHSRRDMPVIGLALKHMINLKKQGGFAEYRNRADQLSANINKFLKNAGLLPTDEHSLYSLRHTFQDKLTAAEVPERIETDLMGHKFSRSKYGEGASLEQKQRWLKKISYSVC